MARVKRGTIANKTRKNKLKMVKGYRFGRSTKEVEANTAIRHAGKHAFNDRRKKKGNFRALWITRLNAALRPHGISYSRFIDKLHKSEINLNRKVLSELARTNPESFDRIVKQILK
ncbi:MAG: ribosomal protein large subunit ribosomal protein [Candidatus Parcubacteria bacterium]|jgi:large subunit ribosomal protein L20